MKTDKFGNLYAEASQIKAGDIVYPDGGFDCLTKDWPYVCMASGDNPGDFYLQCSEHKHWLSGQDDGDGYLVGIYLNPPQNRNPMNPYNYTPLETEEGWEINAKIHEGGYYPVPSAPIFEYEDEARLWIDNAVIAYEAGL